MGVVILHCAFWSAWRMGGVLVGYEYFGIVIYHSFIWASERANDKVMLVMLKERRLYRMWIELHWIGLMIMGIEYCGLGGLGTAHLM